MPNNETMLDGYLNEMYFCYDLNRDGMLDLNETRQMVKGQLGEMNCDTFTMTDSTLLKGRQDLFKRLQALFATYPGQNMQFQLLYRSSRDQCEASDFQSKVEGKARTVTLLTTHRGEIFGGYLDVAYNSSIDGYQSDPNAFLFSLTKNEKYKILSESTDSSMYYDKDSTMLAFGRDDLAVTSGCVGTTLLFGGNY
jgi:hypothetical protein